MPSPLLVGSSCVPKDRPRVEAATCTRPPWALLVPSPLRSRGGAQRQPPPQRGSGAPAARGPRSRHRGCAAFHVRMSASPVLPEAPSRGGERVTEGGAPVLACSFCLSVCLSVCHSIQTHASSVHCSANYLLRGPDQHSGRLESLREPVAWAPRGLGSPWPPWPGLPVAFLLEVHRSWHVWAL